MQGMAATLKPEDMKALGIYFSQQKPKGLAAKDAALVTAGQKLYRGGDAATGVPACAACHAPNGAGVAKNYPRLAGQYADYTYAQLKAFKAGERGADKDGKDVNGRIMATIAAQDDRRPDEGRRRIHVGSALDSPNAWSCRGAGSQARRRIRHFRSSPADAPRHDRSAIVYPVKGCRGIVVSRARVAVRGLIAEVGARPWPPTANG